MAESPETTPRKSGESGSFHSKSDTGSLSNPHNLPVLDQTDEWGARQTQSAPTSRDNSERGKARVLRHSTSASPTRQNDPRVPSPLANISERTGHSYDYRGADLDLVPTNTSATPQPPAAAPSMSWGMFGSRRGSEITPRGARIQARRSNSHPPLHQHGDVELALRSEASFTMRDIYNPRELSVPEMDYEAALDRDMALTEAWGPPGTMNDATSSSGGLPSAGASSSTDWAAHPEGLPPLRNPLYSEFRSRGIDRIRKSRRWAIMNDVGPLSYRKSPWYLMHKDLIFFARHFTDIRKLSGGADGPSSPLSSTVGHLIMVVVSLIITLFCMAALLSGLFLIIVFLYVFAFVCHRFQGPRIRKSKADKTLKYDCPPSPHCNEEEHNGPEKWFFVNGIATLGSGAQAVIDHLHQETGRPITSIHNRSLGAWFDLVECILMRDFHLNTANIRNGYKYIYNAVADPEVDKVVLIGHSQGGIIVTAWVDQLLVDFTREMLVKLEVYTFASAADHFSRARPGKHRQDPMFGNDGLFGRVEHFANEGDFVANYGVLRPDVRQPETNVHPPASAAPAVPQVAVTAPSVTASQNETAARLQVPREEPGSAAPIADADAPAGSGEHTAAGVEDGVHRADRVATPTAAEDACTAEERYGRFTGRIFVRPMHGHSILGHYLCSEKPEKSFLRINGMEEVSRLAAYRGGERRLPYTSWMVDSEGKEIAGTRREGVSAATYKQRRRPGFNT